MGPKRIKPLLNMFPFTVRGKVLLGLRREFHLSTASLEESISSRLLNSANVPQVRRERSPVSQDGTPLIGQVSRLLNMGFLNAVKVRKIGILTRKDKVFAGYEMDVTVTTLITVVAIPLVLGTALLVHSKLSLFATVAIILFLVAFTWGMDTWLVVMLVRHEIRQIATEIQTIMLRQDTPRVEPHHLGIDAEELLATAYYYERNNLMKRSQAYLEHLVAHHPETLEGRLGQDRLEQLGVRPMRDPAPRERDTLDPKGGKRLKWPLRKAERRTSPGKQREKPSKPSYNQAGEEIPGVMPRRRGLLDLLRLDRRLARQARKRREKRARRLTLNEAYDDSGRRKGRGPGRLLRSFGFKRREERQSLKYRDHRHSSPREQEGAQDKRWWQKLFRWESRRQRQARKRRERWARGPRSSRRVERALQGPGEGKLRRVTWFRSREERLARKREERWSKGPSPRKRDHRRRRGLADQLGLLRRGKARETPGGRPGETGGIGEREMG